MTKKAYPPPRDPGVAVRFKTKNEVLDKIDQLMERWEQRITLRDLRFADRFLNFGLNVLLHLRFDTGEVGVICFEQISAGEPISNEKKIMRHGKQGTVLVDIIQFVDSPQSIVPAFVWFEPVDSFYRFQSYSLYFSSLVGFVLGQSLSDGKLDLPEFFIGKRRTANQGKLLCEVVQRGSEVVNKVARNGNHVEGECGDVLDIRFGERRMEVGYGVGRDIKIVFGDDYVRVFEGQNIGCEITQVLVGPLDLYPNKNEPIHGL